MSDQNQPAVISTSQATATPAASPPVETTETAPAQPTRQAAKPAQRKPGQRRPQDIRIPTDAFKARINREANALLKKNLGMSLDEAKALVQGRQTNAATGNHVITENVHPSDATARYEAQIAKAKRDAAVSAKAAKSWQDKHAKDTRRLRDRAIETELRFEAARAGIVDTDYAIHLFAREAAKNEAAVPTKFFGGLKSTHPHLFTATAPSEVPVEVPVTTAPPESLQPGEARPLPSATGTPPALPNAENMDQQQFSSHLRSYGFHPGM